MDLIKIAPIRYFAQRCREFDESCQTAIRTKGKPEPLTDQLFDSVIMIAYGFRNPKTFLGSYPYASRYD